MDLIANPTGAPAPRTAQLVAALQTKVSQSIVFYDDPLGYSIANSTGVNLGERPNPVTQIGSAAVSRGNIWINPDAGDGYQATPPPGIIGGGSFAGPSTFPTVINAVWHELYHLIGAVHDTPQTAASYDQLMQGLKAEFPAQVKDPVSNVTLPMGARRWSAAESVQFADNTYEINLDDAVGANITLTSADTLFLGGSSANDTLILAPGSTANIMGGTGYVANATGAVVNAAAGTSGSVSGTGVTLNTLDGAVFALSGSGNVASITAGDTINLTGGSNETVNSTGGGTVNLAYGITGAMNGSGMVLNAWNGGSTFTINGNSDFAGLGPGSTLFINGTANSVTLGASSRVIASGATYVNGVLYSGNVYVGSDRAGHISKVTPLPAPGVPAASTPPAAAPSADLPRTVIVSQNDSITYNVDGTSTETIVSPDGPCKSNALYYHTATIINRSSKGEMVKKTDLEKGGPNLITSTTRTETFYDVANAYRWAVLERQFGPNGNYIFINNDDGSSFGASMLGVSRIQLISKPSIGAATVSTYKISNGQVFPAPEVGPSIAQTLGGNAIDDLSTVNFLINSNSQSLLATSVYSPAIPAAGSYVNEYKPTNGSLASRLNSSSNIYTITTRNLADGSGTKYFYGPGSGHAIGAIDFGPSSFNQ